MATYSIEELLEYAKEGRTDAMWNLYVLYKGQNKEQEGLNWLRRSAELNFGLAQHEMGLYEATGRCGPINHEKAFDWYLKGANNGNIESAERVGVCDGKRYRESGTHLTTFCSGHWHHRLK